MAKWLSTRILCFVIILLSSSTHAAPIHDAAAKGDLKQITKLISSSPAVIDAVDKDNATPLHYAAGKGAIPIIKFLIDHKANINARKKDGITPLHVAAGVNNLDAVKILVSAKADTSITDDCGRTPLAIAQERGYEAVAKYLGEHQKLPVVWTIDAQSFSPEERLMAACIQGIANRKGPRVYLNTGPSLCWMQLHCYTSPMIQMAGGQSKPQFNSVCDIWIKELTDRKLFEFQPITLDKLIEKLRNEINGVILYQTLDDDLAIAATMAGLRDAIPVTPALYSKWITDKGLNLPTIFDIKDAYKEYNPDSQKRIEAHRWTVKHLYPACDKTGAVSRNKTYGSDQHDTLIDTDIAVQHKWITFDLSYMSSETREDTSKPDPVYGFDPPDKPVLTEILSGLQKFRPVYGWGSEGEFCILRRLSQQNCIMVCTGTANTSFYKKLPLFSTSFVQSQSSSDRIPLEKKIYVAFMVNEGDTIKYLSSFANQGCWLEPERGKIAINWGMDTLFHKEFPGLMSYYTATATPNDYFFAAVGGWGYVHPDGLPEESVIPYAELLRKASIPADLHYVDIWWAGAVRRRNQYFPFIQASGMRGVTDWSDHQGVEYSPIDGTPVVKSNYYYPQNIGNAEQFANELINEAADVVVPWFVVVYGGTPHQFYEITKRLPADKFKVVTLNEFFEAARQARSQVEGRTWKPGVSEK